VAGDDERVPVRGAERPCGTCRAGPTRERRELAVRDDVAARHRAQRLCEVALERRRPPEVDLDIREVVGVACEERVEARDELVVAICRARDGTEAKLIPGDHPVRAPQLAGAPPGHRVARLDGRHGPGL